MYPLNDRMQRRVRQRTPSAPPMRFSNAPLGPVAENVLIWLSERDSLRSGEPAPDWIGGRLPYIGLVQLVAFARRGYATCESSPHPKVNRTVHVFTITDEGRRRADILRAGRGLPPCKPS